MKKLLALFIVLDLIFLGTIFKIYTEKQRTIASLENKKSLTEEQSHKSN